MSAPQLHSSQFSARYTCGWWLPHWAVQVQDIFTVAAVLLHSSSLDCVSVCHRDPHWAIPMMW